MGKHVLITGGAGYIGSHTCVAVVKAGYTPVILDNLSNSHQSVLDRIQQITGIRPDFIEGDTRDRALLKQVFTECDIHAVLHFAGFKSVSESVEQPIEYYDNNINGSLTLLQAMQSAGVKRLVFSSSAAVYGEPQCIPIAENHPLNPTSPYGRSKYFVEKILEDIYRANKDWKIARLRYFNPAGAHKSGLLGEPPLSTTGNLMPHLTRVAAGVEDHVDIYGNDYPTPDGTGLRDYIHVMDLAEGHRATLESLDRLDGLNTFNLGTGRGFTVLETLKGFEKTVGKAIKHELRPRRAGDISISIADPSLARELLGWEAKRGIDDICRDAWNFYIAQDSQAGLAITS
jgi:UDP-glucose 4-epimerase